MAAQPDIRGWFRNLTKANPTLENISDADIEKIKSFRYREEDNEAEVDEGEETEVDVNNTLLHYAAMRGMNKAIPTMVVRFGMDPNAKSTTGYMPLCNAITFKKFQSAKALIRVGANVNGKCDGMHTPLGAALMTENDELIDTILQKGADPNERDVWNRTSIFYAREVRHIDKLLAAGADINARSNRGETALFDVVTFLRDNFGLPIAKKLLESGIDYRARDVDGRTAEDYALYRSREQWSGPTIKLYEFLRDYRLERNAVESRGAVEVGIRKGLPPGATKEVTQMLVGKDPTVSPNTPEGRIRRVENLRQMQRDKADKREEEGSAEAVAAMKAGRKTRARKVNRRKTLRRK